MDKYIFTNHAQYKMRYYRISVSLVKRIIRYPKRVEESIVPETIACMIPAPTKRYTEIWVIYTTTKTNQIKIVTAWRYPAHSPKRNPVPADIIKEARLALEGL